MSQTDLNKLRKEMKVITSDIIYLINKRMEIAKKIGEIKTELDIDIVDDKVEQDIKDYLFQNSNSNSNCIDPEFSGRIVNLLISESIKIQNLEKSKIKINNLSKKNNIQPIEPYIDRSMNLKYNDEMNEFKIKTHLDVFKKAKQLDAKGQRIIHMEVGEPDFLPPSNVREALFQIYDKAKIHYTQTEGISELRTKLSEYLNQFINIGSKNISANIDPNKITITPGGRFAIFCAFSALLKPGDEIIIIEPAWPAYKDCADFMGIKTKIIKTNLESNWEPSLVEIENNININTKIICLNYPNNPTGKILSDKKLHSIIELSQKNNLFILSDEVYCNYIFKPFHSILEYEYDKSILVGSFSKTYSMTGFRVGFAYSIDKETINKLTKIQALALTSVAEPMQYCALASLDFNAKTFSEIMKKRIDLVCTKLKHMPFDFNYPDGAMYVYAQIDESLKMNDLNLVEKLLQNRVAVAPGSGFGSIYSDFIRISTCINEDKLNEGLDIINKVVTDN